ncbi:MAG: efflux RND transporter periplasmic adaptor subunit [Pseudolabrys sp.]|nr:efflux RND transporter periplasmic adaptor subunit [Pseudolabrys sp.]
MAWGTPATGPRVRHGAAGAVLAAAVALAGCGEQNTYVPPPPPKVTVAPPVKRAFTHYLEATGNTAAVDSADLVARVPGFVEAIKYNDGDFVKKGTLLFVIEQKPYALKVESARASEESAQASLKKSQLEYDRTAELLTSGSTTQAKLDDLTGNRDSAKAALEQAVASRKLAENDYDYTSVEAPFDGIVSARTVSVGSYVGSTTTVLATIVRNDPIYVNFNISEKDVLRIRAEIARRGLTPQDLKKVPVDIGLQTDEGYPHRGHLDYAAPTVDASTGTLVARAVLDNPKHVLLPGYFVRVRVPLGPPQDALAVPDTALGTDQGGRYVLTVGQDNVVEQNKVTVGSIEGTMRVIEKGLNAGDRVIVNGIQRAIPGQKVDPQAASAPGAK